MQTKCRIMQARCKSECAAPTLIMYENQTMLPAAAAHLSQYKKAIDFLSLSLSGTHDTR
jgi:hypothetical protein